MAFDGVLDEAGEEDWDEAERDAGCLPAPACFRACFPDFLEGLAEARALAWSRLRPVL